MNRHFEDTRYYVKRAGQEAKRGIVAELEPLRKRVESLTGEEDPDPSRVESLRGDLEEASRKAEGEAKLVIDEARGKFEAYRKTAE